MAYIENSFRIRGRLGVDIFVTIGSNALTPPQYTNFATYVPILRSDLGLHQSWFFPQHPIGRQIRDDLSQSEVKILRYVDLNDDKRDKAREVGDMGEMSAHFAVGYR